MNLWQRACRISRTVPWWRHAEMDGWRWPWRLRAKLADPRSARHLPLHGLRGVSGRHLQPGCSHDVCRMWHEDGDATATRVVRRSFGGVADPDSDAASRRYEAKRNRECWSVQEQRHVRHRQPTPPLVAEGPRTTKVGTSSDPQPGQVRSTSWSVIGRPPTWRLNAAKRQCRAGRGQSESSSHAVTTGRR